MNTISGDSVEVCGESFRFDTVFTPADSQAEVFARIGEETVRDVMEGYNGTIFAYG